MNPLMEHLSRGHHVEVVTMELPSPVFRDYVNKIDLSRSSNDQFSKVLEAYPRQRSMLLEIHDHVLSVVCLRALLFSCSRT
jgi:hypothetical protein